MLEASQCFVLFVTIGSRISKVFFLAYMGVWRKGAWRTE